MIHRPCLPNSGINLEFKDLNSKKSESELEEYSFHCCLQRWLTNSLLDIQTELRCDSLGQLDSTDITM